MKIGPRTVVSVCAILALGVTMAIAQPPGKGSPSRKLKSLRTVEDFEDVKKGDKLGLVCLECHSISETTVEGSEDAMAFCKDDGEVNCPACEKTYKTVRTGQPGAKGHKHRKVIYVNKDGKECAFIANVSQDEASTEDEKD